MGTSLQWRMSLTNSDNLIQQQVSFGDHEPTIMAGLKTERMGPPEVEGRKARPGDLEPRQMRGRRIGSNAGRHRQGRRSASGIGAAGESSVGWDEVG